VDPGGASSSSVAFPGSARAPSIVRESDQSVGRRDLDQLGWCPPTDSKPSACRSPTSAGVRWMRNHAQSWPAPFAPVRARPSALSSRSSSKRRKSIPSGGRFVTWLSGPEGRSLRRVWRRHRRFGVQMASVIEHRSSRREAQESRNRGLRSPMTVPVSDGEEKAIARPGASSAIRLFAGELPPLPCNLLADVSPVVPSSPAAGDRQKSIMEPSGQAAPPNLAGPSLPGEWEQLVCPCTQLSGSGETAEGPARRPRRASAEDPCCAPRWRQTIP